MKPHRRKPTPPRRDDAAPQGGGETPAEDAAPAEPPYAPDDTLPYDPGAALIDEQPTYADPNQAYVDPNQAYVDPNQAYVDPNQAYVDPSQAYVDPNQAYADPNQAYVDPNQAYVDPNQAYVDPNQQAGYPEPTHAAGGIYDDAPQAPSPAAPRPKKKKVVTKRAPRRPHVPTRKVADRKRSQPRPAYSDGGFSMMTVFLTLVALGLLAAVVYVVLPRDMTTVAGYPVNAITSPKPRNLLEEVQQAMVTRTADLTFTEEEVNQYLNHRLQAEQTGPVAALVTFRGVYVDFTPGSADIIIERELFGMPLTMGVTVATGEFRQRTTYHASDWQLGRIHLGKRNIKPVIDLFLRLRTGCLDEFQALQQMVDVKFEENQVFLDATL